MHWGLALLPDAKNGVWAWLLGSSFERLVKWHRFAGRVAVVWTWVHGGCMLKLQGQILLEKQQDLYVLLAAVAFTLTAAVAFEPIRRAYWRLSIAVHVVAAPIRYAFACMHVKDALLFLDLFLRYAVRSWRY